MAPETPHDQLDELESKMMQELDLFCDRFNREVGDVRRELGHAKTKFEDHAEEFRDKLFIASDVSEDEFRARLVMLEIDYGSRVRLAEEGWKMLRDSLEERFETEKVRLRNIIDDLREAMTRAAGQPAVLAQAKAGRSSEDAVKIERLRKLLNEAERRVSGQEHEIGALRGELKSAGGEKSGGDSAELEKMRVDMEFLRKSIRKVASERDAARSDLQAARSAGGGDASAEIENLRRALRTAEAERDKSAADLEAARSADSPEGSEEAVEQLENLRRTLREAVGERHKAVADLEALQQSGGSADDEAVAALRAEIDKLRKRLRGVETERDLAKSATEEGEEALADQKKRIMAMQKTLLGADVTRDKRFDEERTNWEIEKEALEQKTIDLARDLTTIKTLKDQGERDWEATLTRQDAERMQEIFKLRAEIQKLKWKQGPGSGGPPPALPDEPEPPSTSASA